MTEQERYERAKSRVGAMTGFYVHLTVYVLVNLMILAINLMTSPGVLWFIWPLMGWGIGVGAHGVAVFGIPGISTKGWQERKIKEFMESMEREEANHLS